MPVLDRRPGSRPPAAGGPGERGHPYADSPGAPSLKDRGKVNAVIIRKDRKTTGLGNLIEGHLSADPIILVDDVLNSGASVEKAVAALEGHGRVVADLFVLVDFDYAAAVCEERLGCLRVVRPIDLPARRRSGRKLGEWMTDDICYTTPLFVGNRLFCGSGDKHLYVIDLETLQVATRLDLGARVYASPVLIDGSVYLGTNGGSFLELDPLSLEVTGRAQCPTRSPTPLRYRLT